MKTNRRNFIRGLGLTAAAVSAGTVLTAKAGSTVPLVELNSNFPLVLSPDGKKVHVTSMDGITREYEIETPFDLSGMIVPYEGADGAV